MPPRYGISPLLEAHDLTEAMLVEVNVMLMERGLLMTQGTLVDANLIAGHRVQRKMRRMPWIPKCTRPKKQPVAFRQESAHWCGQGLRSGTHADHDGSQLHVLFALSNLYMVGGELRP